MSVILHYLVNILLYLFLKACCHYNYCNYSSPYFRWFQICWTAKVSSGKIAWNEFLALFEYFVLHESRGERYMLNNYYLKLVDMSPFIYDIPEEEWDRYIDKGFCHFKIQGRELTESQLFAEFFPYLIRPQFYPMAISIINDI